FRPVRRKKSFAVLGADEAIFELHCWGTRPARGLEPAVIRARSVLLSGAYFYNFHIKVESFARWWVVGINSYCVFSNSGNSNELWALLCLCLELHARKNFVNTFEGFARYRLNKLVVAWAISFFSWNSGL